MTYTRRNATAFAETSRGWWKDDGG